MYQVRITDGDGSNPVILDKADSIAYNKTINSPTEGISFEVPTSDSKTALIDSTKLWEFWDVAANERVNRGPIFSITSSNEGTTKVSGPGRSQFLADHIKTDLVTFYHPIRNLFDDLRYENVAANPSTKTYVWDGKAETKEIFFGLLAIDEEQYMQYYGLSKQTKDNAIDDNDGYVLPGAEQPSNTFYTTNSHWAGTDVKDSLVLDLGDAIPIAKLSLLMPWWGGITREWNRGYSYEVAYSTYTGDFADIDPNAWVTVYDYPEGRHIHKPQRRDVIWFMDEPTEYDPIEMALNRNFFIGGADVTAQYWRVLITDAHAWYNPLFDDEAPVDKWGHECDPDSNDDTSKNKSSNLYPKMKGKVISDRVIEPQNDCYAGIVELSAYTRIIERDVITPLVKQRIKSDSRQILYHHTPDASETSDSGGFRIFEPGTFFRKLDISYSGASTSHSKFFDKDCTNCYDEFNFAIMDDYNSMIYRSDNSSESNTIVNVPRNVRLVTMKGSADATVNGVDAWLGKVDPLSWGGFYSYNKIAGDYTSLTFRGASFTWWATVPETETGATVLIKIRERDESTGDWSVYTTLEAAFQIPNNVTSEVIYEIPLDTILVIDKTYQIYFENLDDGYMSVDSFGGWWAGSLTEYNEDTDRVFLKRSNTWKQIYDNRFTNGSMLKTNDLTNPYYFDFQGDRIQIYSAKGRNHGKITIVINETSITDFDFTITNSRLFIPGGDAQDGTYTVNLNTGKKGHEVPATLIFDSNNFTGYKFGEGGTEFNSLPWGRYTVGLAGLHSDTYMADPTVEDSDQFVARCSDCSPAHAGTVEIDRFIFVDGFGLHEQAAISSSWKLENHLDILASIAEAIEVEWNVGEHGLTVLPRVGVDTDIILLEGNKVIISTEVVKDGSKMATQLISSGADIDGLPLFSIVENRQNKAVLNRTVQRIQDFRDIADYFTLVGVSRSELVRRREPEFRVTVEHIGYKYGLEAGDSVIVKKNIEAPMRVRINSLGINQSRASGISYSLECVKWPPIT